MKENLQKHFFKIFSLGGWESVTSCDRVADLAPSASSADQGTEYAIFAIRALRSGTTAEAEYNEMRLMGRR